MKTDMRAYMAKRRSERRQWLLDLDGNICCLCGSHEDLQFDHVNRSEKCFTLSGAGLDKPWAIILQEHAKCQLLCSNCHKAKTREFGDISLSRPSKSAKPMAHGSPRRYMEEGCRCDLCKQAKSLYRNGILPYGVALIPTEPAW